RRWMMAPPRYFARGRQQERVAPGDALLHDAELPVIEQRVASDFFQIATDERQMMLVVDRAQRPNALRGDCIADLTAERIARIRRIRDHAARAHDFGRLPHQSRLRIPGMYGKILRHECKPHESIRRSPRPRLVSIYN